MARTPKSTKKPRKARASRSAPVPEAAANPMLPPQRRPVIRDQTCSLMVGVYASQVDCGSCERACGSLPHSWRGTCRAACRRACAVSDTIASAGRRVMSVFA